MDTLLRTWRPMGSFSGVLSGRLSGLVLHESFVYGHALSDVPACADEDLASEWSSLPSVALGLRMLFFSDFGGGDYFVW